MLVNSLKVPTQPLKALSSTIAQASKLETARAAFMAELNHFTQHASHEPGDSGIDRMHAANCLLAALSKEPIESKDGSLAPTRLEFGIHATAASHIPESLAQAMVNLATVLGQKITSVVLPGNQSTFFKWLECMPDAEITSSATGANETANSNEAQKVEETTTAPQSSGRLEDARTNFMAELHRFRQGATRAPGDFSIHREHVVKFLQAAVREDELPDPEVLKFIRDAEIPQSLKQATRDLAGALGREINI